MNSGLQNAMSVSRSHDQADTQLTNIFAAEQTIASMSDCDLDALQKQLAASPDDGFLHLWQGLALANRSRHDEACVEFSAAIDNGCSHWRLGWYIAQSAAKLGRLEIVDQACEAVLKLSPEFWFARELPRHARDYYAQSGQDKIIEEFFAHQPPGGKVFVEVGAFDGVHHSNVRRLHEHHGWTGLCIEPVEKNFNQLVRSYENTDVKCVRAAVANSDGELEVNVSSSPHLPDRGGAQCTKEKVPAKKLTRILEEFGVQSIDLLSVNAAGHDLEVLKSLDFSRYQPRLITVEFGAQRDAIAPFLAEQGYSLLHENDRDLMAGRVAGKNFTETKNFTGLSGKPGYEEIQREMEQRLDAWIEKPADQIERVVIVGGYYGNEIRQILRSYPKAEIHVFEPSRRYFPKLQADYAREPRVKCHQLAVAEQSGSATFHEGSLEGVGSLFPLKTEADAATWIPENFQPAENYQVQTITLDEFAPLQGKRIDLLWCDVQGAELKVLAGAKETLRRVEALFLEVATVKTSYHGQCFLHELDTACCESGFYLAGIGLCPSGNGTGNAVWLKKQNGGTKKRTADWREKVNRHLLKIDYLPNPPLEGPQKIPAAQLVTPQRFDIAAKTIYARHRLANAQTDWAKDLYHAHIRAFSGEACREEDGSKNGIQDYFNSFNGLLDSIRENGFNEARSLVPTGRKNVIIDGSHRVAACVALDREISVLGFDLQAKEYDSEWFRSRGLSPKFCDAMALEYCRLRPDTFIVVIFPAARERDEDLAAILRERGEIVYEKQIQLNRNGAFNLIRQVYADEPWLGNWRNQFAGAWGKANPCFASDGPLRVFLFQTDSLENVRSAKQAIRDLFGIQNHSVHVNDTHEQTLQLAKLFFNDNSVHFLNCAQPKFFEKFERQMEKFSSWLRAQNADAEDFCIDGSAVMAAYGIRESADLDVLHFCPADFSSVEPEVNSHNAEIQHHVLGRDEIIFNPENHFYFNGIKFAALDVIRRLKSKRDESKDRTDVVAIDQLVDAAPVLPDGTGVPALFSRKNLRASGSRLQKIVGLVPARNEAARIEFCLRALAVYTDAIVFLDDCSTDNTVQVVESLAAKCKVERILRKQTWHRDEPADRNAMLRAGREIGGTHFIVLDADEAFTANCAENNFLRQLILALSPGDQLVLNWIQLWRGTEFYRFDNSIWTWNAKPFAFCDDGQCSYRSEFIHTSRVPENLKGRRCEVPGYSHGLLHFQFTNWRNLLIKQAWYRCLERVRDPEKPAAAINERYAPSKDERGLGLMPVPKIWFANYDFFNPEIISAQDNWREDQVLGWFSEYGKNYFNDLDIHNVNWGEKSEPEISSVVFESAKNSAAQNSENQRREVESLLREADAAFAKNDLKIAASKLRKVLDFTPDAVEVNLTHGNILFLIGDVAAARWEFVRASLLQPSNVNAHLYRALAANRLNHRREAMDAATRVLQLEPGNAEAANLLSSFKARDESHKIAVSAERLASPEIARECLEHAERYWKQNEFTQAADWLGRALDLAPNSVELLGAFGAIQSRIGNHETALRTLKRACALRPNDAALLVKLASAQVEAGEIEEFEKTIEQVFKAEPEQRDALLLLAELHSRAGNFLESAKLFHRILSRTPRDVEALLGVAKCFNDLGNPELARQSYAEVLKLDPANRIAENGLRQMGAGPVQIADKKTTAVLPVSSSSPLGYREDTAAFQVSAIVSTYNSERFMRGCLEDLVGQSLFQKGQLEIVVVDSGSEQNERAIVEEFQKKHENILYLRTRREPLYAAWNRGIKLSSGKFLTNANTDDRHRADTLELLAQTLDSRDVGLVYADCLITRNENETFDRNSAHQLLRWPEFSVRQLLMHSIFGPQPMWRRSVHEQIGWFDPKYNIAGDYEFFIRLGAHFGAYHVPQVLGLYLEGGMESQNASRCREQTLEFLRHHRANTSLEAIYPALSKAVASPMAQAAARVDFANCIADDLYPHPDLAIQFIEQAFKIIGEHPVLLNNLGVLKFGAGERQLGINLIQRAAELPLARENLRSIQSARGSAPQLKLAQLPDPVWKDLPVLELSGSAQKPIPPGFQIALSNDHRKDEVVCAMPEARARVAMPERGEHWPISFCIITAGQRSDILQIVIESIRNQKIPEHEIIVIGKYQEMDGILYLPAEQVAAECRRGGLRNLGMARARCNFVMFLDDDCILSPDWYERLRNCDHAPARERNGFDLMTFQMRLPDGSRYWDHATFGGPRGHIMLEESETDPFVYATSGALLIGRHVAEALSWNDAVTEGEDLLFSQHAAGVGFHIDHCHSSVVWHADATYTSIGRVVFRREESRTHRWISGADFNAEVLLRLSEKLSDAEAADCLRGGMNCPGVDERLRAAWENLESKHGGRLSDQRWYQSGDPDYLNAIALYRKAGKIVSPQLAIPNSNGRFVMVEASVLPDLPADALDAPTLSWIAKRLANFFRETGPFYLHMGGAGDALLLLSTFYDRNPESVIVSYANSIPAMRSFFEAFPRLKRVCFLPAHQSPSIHLLIRMMMDQVPNCLGKGATPREGYDEWRAGLDLKRAYKINESPTWAKAFRREKTTSRIALAPKGSLAGMVGSKRNIIDPAIWPNLLCFVLENGFTPCVIGTPDEKDNYPCIEGCEDRRSYSFREQMEHIGNSEMLIAADSWAKTFSALAGVPTIVFDSIKGPDWVGKKDASDFVFLDPWESITVVKNFEQCREVFARLKRLDSTQTITRGKTTVSWHGSFLDHGSLSHVNRHLTAALLTHPDLRIECVTNGAKASPDFKKLATKVRTAPSLDSSITVRHAWPPDWSRPKNGKLVAIQPWEFGSLPTQWVEQAKHVDEFWVPSNYVRDVYVNSGVEAEKVFVVPNGVDPEKFHPQATPMKLATRKKFKFLFVGGTIFRKGPDLLLKAYLENFSASDDVCLVIKDFGGQSVYAGLTIEAQIRAAQSNPNAPEILYLNEEFPPDALPGLFTACNCFVLPYRGEGFGLPALEAMACSLPILVTAGGATDDFVRDEFALRVSAKRMIFGNEISGMKLVKPGWLLEPDVAEIGRKMRAAFCNPTEAAERGRRASDFARQNFSWAKSADIAAARIRAIATQPPTDRSRRREEAANVEHGKNPPSHVGGYTRTKPIELPACAKLGHLAEARELLKQKQHRAAWENTIDAIHVRPFHPEAFLLLAEIALAAGDSVSARRSAQHAHDLVSNWKPAKKFLKGNLRGNAKHDWLVLPEQIANQKSEVKNRLSVCLITKNEERFIAQCLKSVRDIAQQIVVADTGSTDRTVELAKENGAEIFHFAWKDDFSAARNAALEHVTGDWVLILDADEELLPEHRATILNEMQAASVMAYRLPIIDKGKENEGCSYVPRLFRNAPGLFFVGRVHEQVFSSIEVRCEEWGLKNQIGKSALLHHGYTQEIVVSRDKIARNLRLLERAIEELPGEPSLLMNLGLELVRSKQLEAGLERYWEALRVLEKKPACQVVPELRETLLTQLSTHLMAAKRFDEIARLWEMPFAKSNMTASQHFLFGLAQMELNRPAESAAQMRFCLSKRHLPALSPIHPEILKAGPNHCLALSLAALKENEQAEKHFRAALEDDPQSRSVRFDFARFLTARGELLEALKLLHELIAENPQDAQAWETGGKIALSQPDFLEFARDWTGEAIQHFPENSTVIGQRAEALLLSGEVESALPFWRKLQTTPSARNLAALKLCDFYAGRTPRRISAADESAVSREFLDWYRKLIEANASSIVCALNERMDSLQDFLPTFVRIWKTAATQAAQEARS